MNPAALLAIIDGALIILEKVTTLFQEYSANGSITGEQQAKVKARIDALRSADAFAGPEWQVLSATEPLPGPHTVLPPTSEPPPTP